MGKPICQYIETVFISSSKRRLTSILAKKLQAETPRGFELKIVCLLLAFSIQCL